MRDLYKFPFSVYLAASDTGRQYKDGAKAMAAAMTRLLEQGNTTLNVPPSRRARPHAARVYYLGTLCYTITLDPQSGALAITNHSPRQEIVRENAELAELNNWRITR